MARIKLDPFRNVSAAGTAVMTTERIFPNTLEYIVLVLGGGVAPTKAQLTRLYLKLGKKPIWDVTGSQLNSMNLYEGRPSTATVFVLPFGNFRARTIESQFIGAPDFGAIGVRDLTMEITVAGGTTPTIDAWAEVSPPKLLTPQYNRMFRALLRTPISSAGALSKFPFDINYGQAAGALLRRLHVFTANATELTIKRRGVDHFEEVTSAHNNAVLDELGHDPQASIYTYDAIEDDNESKALPTIEATQAGVALIPTQILLTLSGATSADVVADVFTTLDAL
jgi:hypothetical protein